jgi:hypothetical protein
MARDTPPVLMQRVMSLLAEKPTPTGAQIAAKIGKEQPYVSKLKLISELDRSVVTAWTKSWETGGARVPVNAMRDIQLRAKTPRQQRELYVLLVDEAELTKRRHRAKLRQPRRR